MHHAKTTVRVLLLCLIAAAGFLNYWEYSRQYTLNPGMYLDIVRGAGNAPQQYRVLVIQTGWFLHQHAHLGMRHAFALIDIVAALIAGLALLQLVERSALFRGASRMEHWFVYASFLFLIAYYLLWLYWFQRPETLATACFVALMLRVLSWKPAGTGGLAAMAVATLALSTLQALTRADVVFCFYAGVFLLCCSREGRRLGAPRGFLLGLSSIAVLCALGVQWFMMHRVYPNATYGDTAVIQVRANLHPQPLFVFAVFLLPAIWTAVTLLKRKATVEPAFLAPLLGATLFVPIWFTVGRIQEVRIFLPWAMAIMPATMLCALSAAREGEAVSD